MILSALVNSGYHGNQLSVETIACFDTCENCGSIRKKTEGCYIDTVSGPMHVHRVFCNCNTDIRHDILNEEWKIIKLCNDQKAVFDINLIP